MKNWLIHRLGGVPKQTYMAAAESYEDTLATYTNMIHKLEQENAGMTADKAEMEKAAEMVSENLSETISRLNEANRTIHGLRQIVNGSATSSAEKNKKIEELQAEIEAKNAELVDTKVKLLDVLRKKPTDPALRSEIARLKGELELLKRNKFKRGRK